MAVFKFGSSSTGGPGQVIEDHIFASVAERDAYFNPDRLTELVTNTPILVTVDGSPVLQTWSAVTPVNAVAYDAMNWITEQGAALSLADHEVPVKMPGSNVLVGSGFIINPITRALQGVTNIETLADIQSGVSTWRLGSAHAFSSAGENVTVRNITTDTVFHPTWQTTEPTGLWRSEQRTPLGELVRGFVYQGDRSETVTNPNFVFTSLPFDHRLYRIEVEPIAAVDNVVVVVQQRNMEGEFVDYWRSRLINLTASPLETPNPQNIAINPFLDLRASTEYRLIAGAAEDVVLRGNSAGIPRTLLTYRRWVDLPMATLSDVGEYRLNNTIPIDETTAITSENVSQYNNKIWLITSSGQIDITIADNVFLTFFAIHVSSESGAVLVGASGSGAVRIDRESDKRYINGESIIFFREGQNSFRTLSSNIEGTGTSTPTPIPTAWDHAALPAGRIPANNRRWYTYLGAENVTRDLPTESGISSGWHAFFGNDSTTATLFLRGDFRGALASVALLPQQGCEISYNGDIFLEGPAREVISVSTFADWAGNPLRHDTEYSGFSTNSSGINLSNGAARAQLLNRNVRISTRSDSNFVLDLEPIDSGDFADIPVGSGFGVICNGPMEVTIRPASNDRLLRGQLTHNFSNPVQMSPGSAITFIRLDSDAWTTTLQSGTITGGIG